MKRIDILKSAVLSLCINFAFGVYNIGLGFYSHSWWFITLGFYFTLLGVMRFSVLMVNRRETDERFIVKFIGILLIVLSVFLVGTVILSAVEDRGVKHHEIVMITLALYAFTKITLAIINLIKIKKYEKPFIAVLRNISLCDALVSIFSLQRSMLVSFEGMTEQNIRLLNILTGSFVCIAVLFLGLNLTVKGLKPIFIGGRRYNMAKSKLIKANEKIAKTVVGGYKKIEKSVVGGYTKIEDKFIDAYLTRDGETVEEAKARLKNNK